MTTRPGRTHRNRRGRKMCRLAAAILLALVPATMSGCEVFGFMAYVFKSTKVEALYKLTDRPTLVLVDDPNDRFSNPTMTDLVAAEVGYNLQEESVTGLQNIVEPRGLHEMASRLGSDYARVPIDRVGRELGAQQVIHILIASVNLIEEPGLMRPTATVQVKVIDCGESKRLFPQPAAEDFGQTHYTLTVKLRHRSSPIDGRDGLRMVEPMLAKRIARDVARLFHRYTPRQPGQPRDD